MERKVLAPILIVMQKIMGETEAHPISHVLKRTHTELMLYFLHSKKKTETQVYLLADM